jgi:hypothetical protein
MDASQWDPRQWDASQWEAAAVWASIAITLLIAIVGWAYAIRAGRRVKTAIWHSAEALDLARTAEDRTDRLEIAFREYRDVDWAHVIDQDADVIRFRNTGTTAAHDVEIAIDRQDDLDRTSVTAEVVQPLQQLEVPGVPMYDSVIDSVDGEPVTTRRLVPGTARITWRSAAGVPSIDLRDLP